MILLGDKSKFDNLAVLTVIDFQTEIKDGWVTQNVKGGSAAPSKDMLQD